jgi:hypothetical protein
MVLAAGISVRIACCALEWGKLTDASQFPLGLFFSERLAAHTRAGAKIAGAAIFVIQ